MDHRSSLVVGALLLVFCSISSCSTAAVPAPTPISPAATAAPSSATTSAPTPTANTDPTPAATNAIESSSIATQTSAAPPTIPGPVQPVGDPTDVMTGLDAPWSVVFAGSTALISQRDDGRVLELTGDSTRVVGTVDGVVHQGEGGLLGLAIHDETAAAYLYAYFTSVDDNRIVRYPLTGAPGGYGLGPIETIFSGIPKAGNHNGGRISFGPDGMLYATTGDAGRRDDAQDPNSLSGKILRMTPLGQVPADNPIAGNPMYSMGHRNPQGIGWDATGTMWAAEFGQDTWDELNRITPGANYGWPIVEGVAGDQRFTDPVHQWNPDDASPSGIAVIGGTVFIANLKGERLTSVSISDPATSTDYFGQQFGRLRHVVPAPDGSLWILTNNTDGRGRPGPGDDRILRVQLTG